jgi:hypothetical protein
MNRKKDHKKKGQRKKENKKKNLFPLFSFPKKKDSVQISEKLPPKSKLSSSNLSFSIFTNPFFFKFAFSKRKFKSFFSSKTVLPELSTFSTSSRKPPDNLAGFSPEIVPTFSSANLLKEHLILPSILSQY